MMKMLRKRRKGGFTLIELIVVIAILGILAAIAVPRFASVSGTAVTRAHQANLKTIEGAAQMYIASATPVVAITNWSTINGADGLAPYLKMPLYLPNSTSVGYTVTITAAGAVTVSPATVTP